MTRAGARLRRSTRQPAHLVGLSVLRVLLGAAALQFYLSDLGRAGVLWGPHGVIDSELERAAPPVHNPSLYLLSDSQWWFHLVLATGIVVALAFTVVGGRTLSILHAIFLWSVYLRTPELMEGGDNLVGLILLVLPFTVTDAWFSPVAKRRRENLASCSGPSVRALLHNTGFLLIALQVCVVYGVAGIWKLVGHSWQNGQAMYLISQTHQFNMIPAFSSAMSWWPLSLIVGYVTVAVEVLAPVAVLGPWPRLRRLVVPALVVMHVGIMVNMGLVAFGTIMIAADACLLSDRDYARLRVVVAHLWSRARVVTIRPSEPLRGQNHSGGSGTSRVRPS